MAAKRIASGIGVNNFYYAIVTKDDETGFETGAITRVKFLQTISIDRPQDTTEAYGDNIVAAQTVSNGKLGVKTSFFAVPLEDKAILSGATVTAEGLIEFGANDIPPDVAVVFEKNMNDGSSEWYGLYKGKFTRSNIEGKTQEDKVDFQSDEVEGSFVDRITDSRSHIIGADDKGSTKQRDAVFQKTFGKAFPTTPSV